MSASCDQPPAENVRQIAHELVVALIEDFRANRTKINEIVMVPLSILARVFRTFDATSLLLDNNYPSEAAIILLTQFELGLDLGYTALDIKNATEWVEHSGRTRTPSNIKQRVDRLYPDGPEKTEWQVIFRILSGVKHSNPAYSELSFPGRMADRTLVISTGEADDEFTKEFILQLRRFSEYHLIYCAHVMSVFVAKYSGMEFAPRRRVFEAFHRLEGVRQEFVAFLTAIEGKADSFFGIKQMTKG